MCVWGGGGLEGRVIGGLIFGTARLIFVSDLHTLMNARAYVSLYSVSMYYHRRQFMDVRDFICLYFS